MIKKCVVSGEEFEVYPEELEFCKKHDLPVPDISPLVALQKRLSWRNDRNLYRRKCDKSGKQIISMFAADSKMTVYHLDEWWKDDWEATDFGRDYDFGRGFFEQFNEMNLQVPYPHAFVFQNENSEYTNYAGWQKNCYLCFAGNYLQDSMYCYNAQNSADCIDCLFVYDSELCYQCVQCDRCYDLFYSLHCRDCKNSRFLEDCRSCNDCFMCWGLEHKQYCFLNEQYSKEEYEEKIANVDWAEMWGLWHEKRKLHVKPENHNLQCEDCEGEYLIQSKNCKDCHTMAKECQDCFHVVNGFPALKDAVRCSYVGENHEIAYEVIASGSNSQRMFFCSVCYDSCFDLYYCSNCTSCKDCFGCSNLHKKQYCILNRQYSKEEYFELKEKIIGQMKESGEWGQFFPTELSPYAYNESGAMDYFPLEKSDVLARGWQWRDAADVQQDVSGENIRKCVVTGKAFKLMPRELSFYKKYSLPVPDKCPDQRHAERIKLREPLR